MHPHIQASLVGRHAERAAHMQGAVARRLTTGPYWAVALSASGGLLDAETGLGTSGTGMLAVATSQQHEQSIAVVVSQSSDVWFSNISACCKKDFFRPDPRLNVPQLSSEPFLCTQLLFLAWVPLFIKQPAYCQALCGCLKRKQMQTWSAGLVNELWPHAQVRAIVINSLLDQIQ